jgi:hypothetical protein
MLGPSLKSVPGCLVSIVPMLIGEPVALTPGLGPHDEVLVEPVLALAVVLELVAGCAARAAAGAAGAAAASTGRQQQRPDEHGERCAHA